MIGALSKDGKPLIKLAQFLCQLTRLAEEFGVAVLISNQVVANPDGMSFAKDSTNPSVVTLLRIQEPRVSVCARDVARSASAPCLTAPPCCRKPMPSLPWGLTESATLKTRVASDSLSHKSQTNRTTWF